MAQSFQARFLQDGESIDHTPVAAVAAGQVVVQGSMIGVAKRPIAAATLGALAVRGIFDVVKANEQQALGAALYWDADGNPYGGTAGTGCATTTAGGNTFIGFAQVAAGATDEVVRVLWSGPLAVTNTVHNALTALIADPGDAGAIPVTDTGHVEIVTTVAGGETRTLAAPTYLGQMLLISMKTDGGDCVIAVATLVNQTGNNRITLNDAGDAVLLAAKANGANIRWSVVSNDGGALSTA
jgi:predicted RecA/RadA family phage recombinase